MGFSIFVSGSYWNIHDLLLDAVFPAPEAEMFLNVFVKCLKKELLSILMVKCDNDINSLPGCHQVLCLCNLRKILRKNCLKSMTKVKNGIFM
jgi:hypothetical protein